jgi:hypothetical protein
MNFDIWLGTPTYFIVFFDGGLFDIKYILIVFEISYQLIGIFRGFESFACPISISWHFPKPLRALHAQNRFLGISPEP